MNKGTVETAYKQSGKKCYRTPSTILKSEKRKKMNNTIAVVPSASLKLNTHHLRKG